MPPTKITLTNYQPIMVVETDWPAACPSSVALSESSIPVSVSGQSIWVKDIEHVLTGLPKGRGIGISYWEPGWVGSASLGSSCSVSILSMPYNLYTC